MKLLICEHPELIGVDASEWCRTNALLFRAQSIFIPAGQTPIPLYQVWERERPNFLSGVDLMQIDDVATGEKKGLFADFFREFLPSYAKQIVLIEQAERSADLAVLGLGLNGHIAFHEPELPNSFFSGCVRLSEKTCETLSLKKGEWGITYGAAAFMSCRAILMVVRGQSKREVLKRLLAGDSSLPATALLSHANLTILADRDAIGSESH